MLPDPNAWQQVKRIFGDVLETNPSDRTAFVRREAGGDAAVEREVLRLLDLNEAPDDPLDRLQPAHPLLESALHLHALFLGETLGGRYRIIRFLARGGMGEVYEAEDFDAGERIAIKTLRADVATGNRLISLRREIQAARKVRHPNVCRVMELTTERSSSGQTVTFLTMELLEGETLLQRLRRTGPMTEREALPLIRSMAAGLYAAHAAGIVHRDFKSGNVMIVPRPEGPPRVIVMDFGLASASDAAGWNSATRSRETVVTAGTPAYMAPEQIRGQKIGSAADIYALGVVMYEMTTGELPYADETQLSMAVRKTSELPKNPATLAPALRATWVSAILRCLQPNPKKRPDSARQVLQLLETRSRGRMWWRWLGRPRFRRIRAVAWTILIVVLGLGLWRLLPVSPAQDDVEAWMQAVWDLHAGESALAAQKLETALSARRLPVEARAHLAQAWLDLGFPARATWELRLARLEPVHTQSASGLLAAIAQLRDGDREGALRTLDRRVADAASAGRELALADAAALADRMNKPDAADRWRSVLAADPQNPAAHFRLAELQARAGQTRDAEASYLSAELYWRGLGDAAMVQRVTAHRGLARVSAGQFQEAREDLPSLKNLLHLPGNAGYGVCEHVVELMAGIDDNFALPYDPAPVVSANVRVNNRQSGHSRQFDEAGSDFSLRSSFALPLAPLCSAKVEAHLRASIADGARLNDRMFLGVEGFDERSSTGVTDTPWAEHATESDILFSRSLSRAFLREVQLKSPETGAPMLDIAIGDDTTVDYIRVTLVY